MKSETIKILAACFTINFLYGGATRLASVFFVESLHRYGVNRKQASFPYVLAYMIRNLCGPLQGYLQQIFGIKSLVIFGNILGTISIASCFFAEDILTVTILWGVVFGYCFGLGTQYLPSILNAHFTTNRNKANGFSYSGACFGGFMMPPLMEACIKHYGLNGSFLVLAGIMANLIPFSFLLKSEEKKTKSIPRKRKGMERGIETKDDKKIASHLLNPVDNKTSDTTAPETITSAQMKPLLNPVDNKKCDTTTPETLTSALLKPLLNPVNNKNCEKTEPETVTSAQLNPKTASKTCNPIKISDQKTSKNTKKPPSIFTLKNFKIFIDPTFLIMFVMTGGTTLIITTMWTIIMDFVRDKGVGEHLEIYYVMIIPLADIVGRIGSGFVIDKNFLPTTVITAICCVCTGLTLLGLLFTYNYLLLMFIEFLFPIFYGSILILQIALIHEFIQPEKRTMAMVCRAMLFAPLSLTISPMIGYFRGVHGSYDGVIYTLTAISFFCGFIVYFVPHLAKRRQTAATDNIT